MGDVAKNISYALEKNINKLFQMGLFYRFFRRRKRKRTDFTHKRPKF